MKTGRGKLLWVPVLAVCVLGCAGTSSSRAPRAGRQAPPETASESQVEARPEIRIDLPLRTVILPDGKAGDPAGGATQPEPVTLVAPPATDIFLVHFEARLEPWRAVRVQRLTDRPAYDNQPYFEADGKGIIFASAREGQTDIFRYDLGSGESEQLTQTVESEYSPTPIPGWPGFSSVRVEADGVQRLWRFPVRPGAGREPELVFPDIAPVGYHAWIDPETVAMFVLGEPNELVVGDLLSQRRRTLATEIGRALHPVPGRRAVSFVDKTDAEHWSVAILELATGDVDKLATTPDGSEDFVWWSRDEILIGQDSALFLLNLGEGSESGGTWREVADLSEHGIHGITRLAVGPGGGSLAVVGERAED